MSPTVSVIIPCYNAGELLEEAIASVQSQTFRDFETIVVDDGSHDPLTVARLDAIAEDQTLRLLRTDNRGVAAARNLGISEARGRYILPLDADDLIAPDYLEKAVVQFEAYPETCIVCCDALLFGEISGVCKLPEFSAEHLLAGNLLFISSLFRKSDWQAVGGFCEAMRYGWEDWEFWISLTRRCPRVTKISEPLLHYRIRTDSRDQSMTFRQKALMLLLIMSRHWERYLLAPGSLIRLLENSRVVAQEKHHDS